MSESYGASRKRYGEGIFGAIAAGFFFLLAGIIFIRTPDLGGRIIDFFQNFDFVTIPNTVVTVPAPVFPRSAGNLIVYRALEEFSFAFGVFQLALFGLRLAIGSSWRRLAETASNFVFWVGAGYLALTVLIQTTGWPGRTAWFVFWAGIIMVAGLSLIVRAIVLAAVHPRRIQ
jgi:hypothetical protein